MRQGMRKVDSPDRVRVFLCTVISPRARRTEPNDVRANYRHRRYQTHPLHDLQR